MTDSLLSSLRDHMLDEGEPLAGLLRKCLMLGAETGSNSLRQWARKELNGYGTDDELPSYRKLPLPPLAADTVSGNSWATNMTYSVLQLPTKAREFLGDEFPLYQPVEELEQVATQQSLSFANGRLTYAQQLWNEELGPYQEVMNLRFIASGSMFAGVVGQIRTQLVDLIADLTSTTPLEQLPRKEAVDAAVGTHIGVQYNTTIQNTSGPTAVGNNAVAKTEGLSVDDAIRLLDAVRESTREVEDETARAEILGVLDDLQNALRVTAPSTTEVVGKVGSLKEVAARIGGAGLSAAVAGAVEGLTTMVMSGAFG
ncbi:AbiTii domain-containing protein [Microbacterium sp. GXF0217]